MPLQREHTDAPHLIRSYAPGQLRLAARVLTRSCIITARELIEDWPPTSVEQLTLDQLEPLFSLRPELVILGIDGEVRLPPAPLRAQFAARRIGLETMSLGAAARTFNVLVQEERNVAAAMLLRAAAR
jgi:uncharacterized protein